MLHSPRRKVLCHLKRKTSLMGDGVGNPKSKLIGGCQLFKYILRKQNSDFDQEAIF